MRGKKKEIKTFPNITTLLAHQNNLIYKEKKTCQFQIDKYFRVKVR